MKLFKSLLTAVLGVTMACSVCALGAAEASPVEASASTYDVEIASNNNLATNKWDWATDKVGSAETYITEDGLRMENFNLGGSAYAVYQTNRFTEFKYSMYGKLSLTRPSDYGFTYQHDYSNLYISFMINAGETLTPAYTCPWNGNKAYFSVCFENLQGSSKTQLYLNDSYVGNGAVRKVVTETTSCNWNDGTYHWFEFEFRKATVDSKQGMQFKLWFDGVEALSYFQSDTDFTTAGGVADTDFPFSSTTGYLGYWTSSDYPVGADTVDTNCYVDIKEIQITSYDNNNTTPYAQCAAPEFDVTANNYSPAASYEVGEEIEIKLSDLFNYEGEEALSYEITCNEEEIGSIRNGYWVWTPDTAGTYDIDVKAKTVDDKEAVNYLTLRVTGSSLPTGGGDTDDNTSGCGASVAGVAGLATLLLAGAFICKRRGE